MNWHADGNYVFEGDDTEPQHLIATVPMRREDRRELARWIATLPDLLEACKALVALVEMEEEFVDPGTDAYVALWQARAAIARENL